MGKTKYIDADKVIGYANQEVTAAFYYPQGSQSKLDEDAYREKWAFVKKVMVAAPAADVVEVVRCKDCKHYKTMFCKMDVWHKDITLYRADENDFCSYGERKDG